MATVSIKVSVEQGHQICESLAEQGIWPDVGNAKEVMFGTAKHMEIKVPEQHRALLQATKKRYAG